MGTDRLKGLSKWPWFLYLLPVFFVFHGFTENYFLIPVADSLLLVLKYLLCTALLHMILFFAFGKNNLRASFILFILLLVFFFFGAFHDAIRSILPGTFFSRYTFVLVFIFIIIALAVLLIRRKKRFGKAVVYLTLLLLILIIIDVFTLSRKVSAYDRQQQLTRISAEFTVCDTCAKPDIYLIVVDEYAGEKTLHDLYQFDNAEFLEDLAKRKFTVVKNSMSNYNLTPISIASLLNLDYVKYKGTKFSDVSIGPLFNLIDTNILVPFLRFQGYQFINNSVFNVGGQPPMAIQPFTPVNTRLIESQTLTHRLMKDLGYHLVEWHIFKSLAADDYATLKNNNKIIENIKSSVLERRDRPRFSYSHLTMPHFPYYYDSRGKPYPHSAIVYQEGIGNEWHEDRYVEYLKYTNGVLINLLDFILQKSGKPPVVILISDHGFRFTAKNLHEEYDFYNLIATFLPGQYDHNFQGSLTNLSYMRDLLNRLFKQHLSTDKQDKFYIPQKENRRSLK